jgi:hypothetical protein
VCFTSWPFVKNGAERFTAIDTIKVSVCEVSIYSTDANNQGFNFIPWIHKGNTNSYACSRSHCK